ncbi:bifunctional ADP-dependent NAD(P)H-hydrate dehydratase/NAD(P)H-hydrate epimerase [Gluconobacter morbifer]|uniref:Bifunctional NAD(P)H-hydrate repair enzyme n=1 Tax=Gluconobacter morbifer G707 TaxID=1088869 RepID=G6XIE5_9PROT|nr:bifunctional ADP-dependent NAD(P)H-hydrate dehydratase/NAD(P)H-hydrate epimerase [Gluconobacter morbifer]EHH68585.1 putative sugar kinase [Gluconobacter morbifer G707]
MPPFPFALLTPAESAAMDHAASSMTPVSRLMENAGWAVARSIRSRFDPCRVVVACGPGNNGGDGYVAARHLAQWGWSVVVAAMASPKEGTPAYEAASLWTGPVVPFVADRLAEADLVVDAVFGSGLKRPVSDEVWAVLQAAEHVVAIDMPSGVSGASGEILGYAPQCLMTVTFVRPRPGHLLGPGAELCGEVVCADIGMPVQAWDGIQPSIQLNQPGLWRIPVSSDGDYKYRRGVVSLCAGEEMPGATRLSARGARRTGAGLVRIAAGKGAPAYRLGDPGLIIDDAPLSDLLEDRRRQVWICGPGLTPDEVAAVMPQLLSAERTVLADAGALAWGAEDLTRLKGVAAVTPHIGEFRKLFGPVNGSKLDAALDAARRINAVVVMKGPDTVIAAPDGRIAINRHASSALATAGSGDTLTGVIAALLAAKMDVWEACCAGVWLHGEAGIEAGKAYGGWPVAEDLDAPLGLAREKAARLAQEAERKNPTGSLL